MPQINTEAITSKFIGLQTSLCNDSANMTLSINGTIQNNDVSILLDTGCNFSCLNDRYKYLTENIGGNNVSLISAKATPMHASGRAMLMFHILRLPYVKRVYLINKLKCDFFNWQRFLISK